MGIQVILCAVHTSFVDSGMYSTVHTVGRYVWYTGNIQRAVWCTYIGSYSTYCIGLRPDNTV